LTFMASHPHRWRILAVVATAFFMTILDVSIVNVALPSIGLDLDFSAANLQWVITAYAITFGGFLLLGGRAADLIGRRVVFMVGVALFTVASLVCGLSQSEGMLIASRAVQLLPRGRGTCRSTLRRGTHKARSTRTSGPCTAREPYLRPAWVRRR
jgi:MFS family permease